MERQLIQLLLSDTNLQNHVSNRIRPVVRPQIDALPAITIQVIDSTRSYTYQSPDNLKYSRVQIDCWATSYAESSAISNHVERLLSGIKEPFNSFLLSANDIAEELNNTIIYRKRMDFSIIHKE